jgi:hypothetical protein
LRSEEFNDAYWVKLAASIAANIITSPDGTINADKLIEDTSGSAHRFISTSFSTLTGGSYTVSIFLKKAGRDYAYIRLNNSGGDIIAANINLLNGTVSQSIFGNITIVPYNNDWYRVIATGTSISTSNGSFEVRTSNSATYANYTGNGTDGIYLWGAQLEAGANATSYIPTVASAVTRNADVISKTGISDLINSSEGVLFAEFKPSQESLERGFSLSDNTISNIVSITYQINNNNFFIRVLVNGIVQAAAGVAGNLSIYNKIAVKYKLNDFSMWINGVLVFSDTQGITFESGVLNTLQFARGNQNQNNFFGDVNQVMVFPTALSDAELQQLTTL